jgi:hypothetical protein
MFGIDIDAVLSRNPISSPGKAFKGLSSLAKVC